MFLISIPVSILHDKKLGKLIILKLNPSDQERNNEGQFIHYNKDDINTNNINGKSEISVITNCINNNFENINNSAMKGTGNMRCVARFGTICTI